MLRPGVFRTNALLLIPRSVKCPRVLKSFKIREAGVVGLKSFQDSMETQKLPHFELAISTLVAEMKLLKSFRVHI